MTHLACIMDGNRRWANRRGLLPWRGHSEGIEVAKHVIDFCLQKGVLYLSLYTFSIENFINRSPEEITYIFNLIKKRADTIVADLKKKGVKICVIGDRSYYSDTIKKLSNWAEHETADGNKMQLNILLGYGARQEIVDATKKIVMKVQKGDLSTNDITSTLFEDHLWFRGIPDPDIIVRTGGHKRLSNFLLYQAAYSELYFLDCLWPDLTKEHLNQVVDSFNHCERNFGS